MATMRDAYAGAAIHLTPFMAPPRVGQFIRRGTVTVRRHWRDWCSLQPGRYVFTFQYNFAANYPGLRSQWASSAAVRVEISVRDALLSEVERCDEHDMAAMPH